MSVRRRLPATLPPFVRLARRARLARLAPLALLLAACSPDPPSTPPLLRLWLDNGPDFPVEPPARPASGVAGAAGAAVAEVGGPFGPAAEGAETVLDADLARAAGAGFFAFVSGIAADGSPDGELRCEPLPPPGGELLLQRGTTWAVATAVPVRGGEGLAVHVKEAGAGAPAGTRVPALAIVQLREPFDRSQPLSPQAAVDLVDPGRHATVWRDLAADGSETSLGADFVTDRLTQEILVVLLAPREASVSLRASRLLVRRLPVGGFVAAGGEFPRMRRLAASEGLASGAVAIVLDRDERKGLLATRTWTFSVGRCAGERRLDLALGVAPRDGRIEGRTTVRIEAAGRVLHEERLAAPSAPEQAAWRDLSLQLPPTPDEALRITFTAVGDGIDPPLVVFGHPEVRTRGPRTRPNVVLISLDTVRPDRLGCYGGDKTLTPNLDALAAGGLRFTQACSTSSYTLPSHGSMLTGQYPAVHGAVDPKDRLDAGRSPFLAALLADAGYVTAAFTGGGYVLPDYGFARGFDRYSSNDPVWALDGVRGHQLLGTVAGERAPAELPLLRRYAAPMVERWLAHQADGVPFFAFLHTYVAHNYAPSHDWLVRRNLLDELGREVPFNHQGREAFNHPEKHPGASVSRDEVYRNYMPYYDATLGMADEFVGGVVEALRGAGLLDDTLIIVTSDHGEEFGEHGFFGHGETLFEAATRVPLIVHLPRSVLTPPDDGEGRSPGAAGTAPAPPPGVRPLVQPAVLSGPLSLVDLAPWVLRLVGLPPEPRMAIAPPLQPDDVSPPRRQLLFMELDAKGIRLSAVRENHIKLHTLLEGASHGIQPDQPLLFDLAPDRGELNDLSGEPTSAADVERLQQRLKAFHDYAESLHPRGQRAEGDWRSQELQDGLKQLGY